MDRRTLTFNADKFNTRAEDGNLYIEGYFAVFGSFYELWDGAFETIDPGAFSDTIGDDVRALINHDTTLVLGRTTAGTLTLRVDERGLFGSVLVNQNDTDAMNVYARVQRGDVSQCSFGFDILEEKREERTDGSTVWTLMKVKLYEVSVCTFPAYTETGVEARKTELETVRKRKIEQWREKAVARLKGVMNDGA